MAPDKAIIGLQCGIEVELIELHQRRCYIDVIEGVPCRTVNDRRIAELREGSSATLPTYVVPPVQQRRWRHGDPDKGWVLPDKECRAILRGPSQHDDPDTVTELEVIFFQEPWAMPIVDDVLDHIRAFDWFALARERIFA